MSEGRPLMKLVFGWVVLWGVLLGCLLLGVVVLQALDQRWGLYMSRSRDLHSLYTRSFSIIGGLWLLLLGLGY